MYKIVTQPASEPLSLEEAKDHLRVTGSEEDSLINNLITAVRNEAENYLNRVLITQVWDLYLDSFPAYSITLNKTPVQSVTSIKYYDGDNSLQTWAATDYDIDHYSEPANIFPAFGKYFPVSSGRINSVIVRMTCGYGDSGDVPDAIKSGMLMYLTYLYDNRGDATTTGIPHAVWNIWNNYRIRCL